MSGSLIKVYLHFLGNTNFIHLLNGACVDLDISYNAFKCDCTDYEIISAYQYYTHSHWLDNTNCEQPSDLYNTKVGIILC